MDIKTLGVETKSRSGGASGGFHGRAKREVVEAGSCTIRRRKDEGIGGFKKRGMCQKKVEMLTRRKPASLTKKKQKKKRRKQMREDEEKGNRKTPEKKRELPKKRVGAKKQPMRRCGRQKGDCKKKPSQKKPS